MSRVGKKPIVLPDKVKVNVANAVLHIEGPKGKFSYVIPEGIRIRVENTQIVIERGSDEKKIRSLHGTARALINNMIIGVTEGFRKELEIVGMGYKAQIKGTTLSLQIGFSHPVEIGIPKDLKISASGPTKIIVEGIDKHAVGGFAAKVRAFYFPEPYKGKGIRYAGEEVRKKLGKAMAK